MGKLELRPAGAGGGRLQVAASDARAGLHRRPLESSRRSSGARPRHGGSAPPVRSGAGSSGSGAGAKHIQAEASGGALGGRTRLIRAVRVFSVCLVVRGCRAVCYAGTCPTVEMA